jgi:hypothetical protein
MEVSMGPTRHDYLALIIATFLAHGLLLFNDGVYWDAWIYHHALLSKNWQTIYIPCLESGVPQQAYFFWYLGGFADKILSFRLVAFICVLLSGIMVYRLSMRFDAVTRQEGLVIALVFVLYPVWSVSVISLATLYVFCYSIFLFAALVAFRSEEVVSIRHGFLRVVSLILFFGSFATNSLLVFYFGFLWLLYVSGCSGRDKGPFDPKIFGRFLVRHLDYFSLPFVFWFIKEEWFPRHGLYAGYNQFRFSLFSILVASCLFFKNAVYAQLNAALLHVLKQPFLGILLVGIAIKTRDLAQSFWAAFFAPPGRTSRVLLFALVLLGMGAFPYAIVGVWPTLDGWNSRQALLMGIPLAIALVACSRFVFSDRGRRISVAGTAFFAMLLLGFLLSNIDNYLGWQLRWIKDRSIMVNLADNPKAEDQSVFLIEDRYPIGPEDYRFYEWASIFKQVWGDEKRIGFSAKYDADDFLTTHKEFFSSRYVLSSFDPQGCRCLLTITPGPHRNLERLQLISAYFYHKMFQPESLQNWLRGMTRIEISPISAENAVNCRKHGQDNRP